MQRLIFLYSAETDHVLRDRVLSKAGDAMIERLLQLLVAPEQDFGNVVIFTSHERGAMVTGAEIFYRIGGEPALAKVAQLGSDDGKTASNRAVIRWFATVSSKWDTVFFISHSELIERFPAYWMRKILKVEKPPKFRPDITQAIYIDIPSRSAKII